MCSTTRRMTNNNATEPFLPASPLHLNASVRSELFLPSYDVDVRCGQESE